MKLLLVMLALFSFSSNERYKVNEYSCENNQIRIRYENNWYDVELFNIVLKNEDICGYVEGEMEIEFDSMIKMDIPLNVYVYMDNYLLQQRLIDENKASIKINNPLYKNKLVIQSTKSVMKETSNNQLKQGNNQKKAYLIIMIWGIISLIIIYRIRCNHKNKQENQLNEKDYQ